MDTLQCFVVILLLPSGRYHPCYFRYAPLPGHPAHLLRFKSGGHHTAGFETHDEAKAGAVELAGQIHGYRNERLGLVLDCPPDRVVTDSVIATNDPVMSVVLPPFGDGKSTFADALRVAV